MRSCLPPVMIRTERQEDRVSACETTSSTVTHPPVETSLTVRSFCCKASSSERYLSSTFSRTGRHNGHNGQIFLSQLPFQASTAPGTCPRPRCRLDQTCALRRFGLPHLSQVCQIAGSKYHRVTIVTRVICYPLCGLPRRRGIRMFLRISCVFATRLNLILTVVEPKLSNQGLGDIGA